jgi:TPR repeat protein
MFFLACRYIEQIYELFSDPSEESARVKLANAAVDWMQKSAEQGCQRALQALGDWYTQGTSQPPYFLVDYPKALRYYTLSTQVSFEQKFENPFTKS